MRPAVAPPCPRCVATRVAVFLRGLPARSEELERAVADDEIAIGGCIVLGDEPEYRCNACHHEWRVSPIQDFE